MTNYTSSDKTKSTEYTYFVATTVNSKDNSTSKQLFREQFATVEVYNIHNGHFVENTNYVPIRTHFISSSFDSALSYHLR